MVGPASPGGADGAGRGVRGNLGATPTGAEPQAGCGTGVVGVVADKANVRLVCGLIPCCAVRILHGLYIMIRSVSLLVRGAGGGLRLGVWGCRMVCVVMRVEVVPFQYLGTYSRPFQYAEAQCLLGFWRVVDGYWNGSARFRHGRRWCLRTYLTILSQNVGLLLQYHSNTPLHPLCFGRFGHWNGVLEWFKKAFQCPFQYGTIPIRPYNRSQPLRGGSLSCRPSSRHSPSPPLSPFRARRLPYRPSRRGHSPPSCRNCGTPASWAQSPCRPSSRAPPSPS